MKATSRILSESVFAPCTLVDGVASKLAMQATSSKRGRQNRRMPLKRQLVHVLVLLGLLSMVTRSGFAQTTSSSSTAPLSFGNNYFVTGDYVVAGAYNMTTSFSNGYAVGTINVPDTKNKG